MDILFVHIFPRYHLASFNIVQSFHSDWIRHCSRLIKLYFYIVALAEWSKSFVFYAKRIDDAVYQRCWCDSAKEMTKLQKYCQPSNSNTVELHFQTY